MLRHVQRGRCAAARSVPLPLVVALVLALALAACGRNDPVDAVAPSTEEPLPAAAPSPEPAIAPADDPVADDPVARGPVEEPPTVEEPPPPRPEPPVPAEDPAGLATQLTEVERLIRSDDAAEADLEWHGHLQQAAYRQLARNPSWVEEVLAGIPDDLRHAVRENATAGAELRSMVTPREPGQLPAWRIVPPAPADELLGYYREAESTFGVPWQYLAAIHLVETRMGRIRGTSTAGAQGPMQFMPGTWEAYGEGDVNDNRDAILAAGRYLRASGAPGDMPGALFRYNRDQRYVRAINRYAEQMAADERAYRGYYHWQVYYLTTEGDVLLPVGYDGGDG